MCRALVRPHHRPRLILTVRIQPALRSKPPQTLQNPFAGPVRWMGFVFAFSCYFAR